MDLEHHNKGQVPSSESSDVLKYGKTSRFSNMFDLAHTPITLIFISSILEIVLGVGVVFAALAGFLEPMWFSNFMCLVGSLACMVGIYLLYNIIHKDHKGEQLIRDAMHRIMNAQN